MLIKEQEDIEEMTRKNQTALDDFQHIGLQTFEELEASVTKDSPKETRRLYREVKHRPIERRKEPFVNNAYLQAQFRKLEGIQHGIGTINERIG